MDDFPSKDPKLSPKVYPLETIGLTSHPEQFQRYVLLDSRKTDMYELRACEFQWGLRKDEINLNCSLNTISAQPRTVEAIRDGYFALLPTQTILDRMNELSNMNRTCPLESRRSCFEVFPEQEYEYVLWPVLTDLSLFVHPSDDDRTRDVQCLKYPYTHFLRVSSHVHPFFVVQHSYVIANALAVQYYAPRIAVVMGSLWQKCLPPGWRLEECPAQSKFESESDSDSDSSSDPHVQLPFELPDDDFMSKVQVWRTGVAEYGLRPVPDFVLSDTEEYS